MDRPDGEMRRGRDGVIWHWSHHRRRWIPTGSCGAPAPAPLRPDEDPVWMGITDAERDAARAASRPFRLHRLPGDPPGAGETP